MRRGHLGFLGAFFGVLAAPSHAAEFAATLARYSVQESATPVRDDPLWRKPHKVLLRYGTRAGELAAFRAAVPDVNIVVAGDVRSAATAAIDVDVIIGSNPEICDPRIINNAKQARWLASLSAGVENCMELPAVEARSLMMTNMRGVDSPVIAEHAITLMPALARTADVIVSAVPLTPATTDMCNKEFFAVPKPTAFFINVARGGSVVTEALTAALNDGHLAGAGLDVVDPEPLPAGHPLWKTPQVLITPHITGWSDLPEEARWTLAIENLRRYVAGGKMLNMVDLARGF